MTDEQLRTKFYQLMGDSIEALVRERRGTLISRSVATSAAYDAIESWLVEHPEYRGQAERIYREKTVRAANLN
jgi:hypothetical protein